MRTHFITKTGIQIGIRAPFARPDIYGHMLAVQSALLDKRTATPLRGVRGFFGALWAWL